MIKNPVTSLGESLIITRPYPKELNLISESNSNVYWLFSMEANNLGTLISGICALILAAFALVTFIYGPSLIVRWQREKRVEKLSDIAEEALNHLDVFNDRIDDWLKFADTWFIYNRQSYDNIQKLNQLPDEEKKKLADLFDNDRHEVHNYTRAGYDILRELRLVKYKALRLSNPALNSELDEFEKIVKKLPDNLFSKHFPVADAAMKMKAEDAFRDAANKIEIFYRAIHKTLVDFLIFQNKN